MEYLDRLYDSAKAIDLEIPISKEEFAEIILETLRKNKLKDAYIRPIVLRGIGDLGLDPRKCGRQSIIVITREWGKLYGDLYEERFGSCNRWLREGMQSTLYHPISSR